MSITLTPLADHVIVKPHRETTTPGGLVIPDTVKDQKSDRGEVIAVGEGRLLDNGTRAPMSVAVGDHVLFSKYAADEVELDGQEYVVITEGDIKAKLTK